MLSYISHHSLQTFKFKRPCIAHSQSKTRGLPNATISNRPVSFGPLTCNSSLDSKLYSSWSNDHLDDEVPPAFREDAPALPKKTNPNHREGTSSWRSNSLNSSRPSNDHDDFFRDKPSRTRFVPKKQTNRTTASSRKRIEKAASEFIRGEFNPDRQQPNRSEYRNDKPLNRNAMMRLVKKQKALEQAIPLHSRVASELSPTEPPDFTLAALSVHPEGATQIDPRPAKRERRLNQLKPVTEAAKREKMEIEMIDNLAKIALEAQAGDQVKNCWGCGIEFQTEQPNLIGYVPAKVLERYKLEKKLHELKVNAELTHQNDPFRNQNEQFVPTEEMLELERLIMQMDDEIDPEGTEIEPTQDENNHQSQQMYQHSKSKIASNKHDHEAFEGALASEASTLEAPERVLCERCWNLRNKSKVVPVSVTAEYFREVVKPIKELKTRPLIIKMVDLFDFHGSFIPHFRKYIGNNRVLIVASKLDLLPKGAHLERVRSWVFTESKKFGIEPVTVSLISNNGTGVRELADQIEYYRDGADVYVMGSANVGKSTFINMLIDTFKGPKDKKVTVSPVPGTTLNFLSLPIGSSSFLYDTPGIITGKQIYHLLAAEELKKMMPKKKIRPSVYRLAPGRSLFIGGLARFDYIEGPPLVYFTLFASNELYIHKTSIDKADNLYEEKLGGMLTPPSNIDTLTNWPGLVPGPIITVNNDDGNWQKAACDIVFSGLGWISITMKGECKVRAWYPEGCLVGERPALMPFESHLGVLPNPRFNMKPSSVATRPRFDASL